MSSTSVHPSVASVRAQLGLPTLGRLVLYSGRFAADHPLDLLVDAAPLLMDQVKVLHFVIIGDGPTRHRLEGELRRRLLDAAVIFAGDVPREQVAQFATACDVGLHLSQSVGSSRREFNLREVTDFLAAGRPVVVASDNADARCFVQANDVGLATGLTGNRTADLAGLVKTLGGLLLDDRGRARRGENAKRLAKALSTTASGGVLDIVRATLRRAAAL